MLKPNAVGPQETLQQFFYWHLCRSVTRHAIKPNAIAPQETLQQFVLAPLQERDPTRYQAQRSRASGDAPTVCIGTFCRSVTRHATRPNAVAPQETLQQFSIGSFCRSVT